MSLARVARFRPFSLHRTDVLVALVLTVPVVGSLVVRASRDDQPLVVLLALAALAAVLVRRARPGEALLMAVTVNATMPDNRTLLLPVMAVLYAIACQRPWPTAAAAGAAAALSLIVAGVGWATPASPPTEACSAT